MADAVTKSYFVLFYSRHDVYLGHIPIDVSGDGGETSDMAALNATLREIHKAQAKKGSFIAVVSSYPSQDGEGEDEDDEYGGYFLDEINRRSVGAISPDVIGYFHVMSADDEEDGPEDSDELDETGEDPIEPN